MVTQPDSIQRLVDLDRGVISREIFVNEAIFSTRPAKRCVTKATGVM